MFSCGEANCSEDAIVTCECNKRLNLCENHFQQPDSGEVTNEILISILRLNFKKRSRDEISKLKALQRTILNKGQEMITNINNEVKSHINRINLRINEIKKAFTLEDFSDDAFNKLNELADLEDKGDQLSYFQKLTKKCLRLRLNTEYTPY